MRARCGSEGAPDMVAGWDGDAVMSALEEFGIIGQVGDVSAHKLSFEFFASGRFQEKGSSAPLRQSNRKN